MSSLSDSSDASSDEASKAEELPVFRTLTEQGRTGRRKKRRDYGGFGGLKFFDLSEKQKQREREKLLEEFKDQIAEYAEIDKYEIKTEPFTYRTRDSSLSPRTPPGRPKREESPLQDTLQDVSLPCSSADVTVSDRAVKAKRVMFLLTDGSVVSSDDESVVPRRPLKRRAPVLHNRRSPIGGTDGGTGGWDTSDTDGDGGLHVRLTEVPGSKRTLPSSDSDDGFQEPKGRAEATPLTKADVLRKRRERIERERRLYKRRSHRRSSSADSSSSREAGGEAPTPLAAPRRRASGDAGLRSLRAIHRELFPREGPQTTCRSNTGRNSPATSHSEVEGGDAVDPLGHLAFPASRQGGSLHRFSSFSSGSGLPEVSRPSGSGSALSVWHSTPLVERPQIATPSATRISGALHAPSRQMFAAGVDYLLKQRKQVLDRGDIRVEFTTAEPGRQTSATGVAAHGADQSDAKQHGTSDSQRGRPPAVSSGSSRLDTAHRSIVVRFGLGSNRERVLVSNAPSVASAIASLCEEERPMSSALEPLQLGVEPVDMLNQLLRLCGQEMPVTFDEALRLCEEEGPAPVFRKLGEGSAAEVYLVRRPGAPLAEESVIKVIPVGGDQLVDCFKPQSLAGASAELAIARELSNLRFNATNRTANFIGLKGAHCVQGPYHPALLASWRVYEERFFSENENPEIFGDEQLYLILDYEYGGKPLENFKGSVDQLESVFVQVSCSLAAAELALQFEHRDLHAANVLVRLTEEEYATYTLQGREVTVPTAGVWASIIDYTLSRISKGEEEQYAAAGLTQSVVFTDLALDSQLFIGSGSFQYDIYRIMRERNGNDWKAYEPFTNVLWLDYLARKLLAKCPKGSGVSGASPPLCARLIEWVDNLQSFPSAVAFATRCLFPAPRPANRKRRKEQAPPVPGHHGMALRRK